MLAGATAYSLATVGQAHSGGDPTAGPAQTAALAGGGFGRPGAFGPSESLTGGQVPEFLEGLPGGDAFPDGGRGGPNGGPGAGGFGADRVSSALVKYLESHQGKARWIVAVNGASEAAALELQTGKPVMAMGGFLGSDPAPTLSQLEALVKSGELRYIILAGPGGGGGPGGGSSTQQSISQWVEQHGKVVDYGGGSTGGSMYDLSGAVV
jgi:hypothetical protein